MPSKNELVSEAKRLDREGVKVTKRNWLEYSDFNYHDVRRVFGGLNDLKRAVGLVVDNRGGQNRVSDEELLSDLRGVAGELGESPTRAVYNERGVFESSTFEDRFDGWNGALVAAGLEVVKGHNVDREEFECPNCGDVNVRLPSNVKDQKYVFCNHVCRGEFYGEGQANHFPDDLSRDNHPRWVFKKEVKQDYVRVADLLGKTPAQYEYNEFGKYSYKVIRRRWGSMRALQEECGLEPLRKGRVDLVCEFCEEEYSLRASLAGDSSYCSRGCMREDYKDRLVGEGNPNWLGGGPWYYGPNWNRQRRRVLARDDYRCQVCGCGEEENYRGLSVHHITPLREFDCYEEANRLWNLIAVCDSCHGRVEAGKVSVQAKL